jgi:transposase InsO family protein
VAAYGVPKEMLSDQGRQYASWRGTTRFEAELRKDRVHHIKSRPHHPRTLGKIERFWKTIWEEFLVRAQFHSFASAGERIRLWVKHYNHRRPPQSLEGMCPADGFFAIAQELRPVIERGIQDNVLELALRGQYQNPISRRDLQALTETARRELAPQHQVELRHITWPVPGLGWSLDDAELGRLADHKLYLHQGQDLASRYKFTPWVGEQVLGETVAVHLQQLFLPHGPPLVLKRDNGSHLNQPAVDEVLARYLVMPLNSPPPYPPYNGGRECAGREMKTPLVEKILAAGPPSESQVQAWAEVLAHELNHRSRGCLDGHLACRVFQDAKPALQAYTLRKRRKIFACINELTPALIQALAVHTQRQVETARRRALESWLQTNGVITITQNKKVLPLFPQITAHN